MTLINPGTPHSGQGWIHTSVKIPVPDTGNIHPPDDQILFEVDNLAIRRIIPIITEAFSKENTSSFHYTPFYHYWQPTPDSPEQRVYDEIYSTNKFIRMHEEINALPRDPDDHYECVVVPLMLWSDSTRLTNFGDASLWPIYLYFGNESKYSRCCPTKSSCYHLAYLPKVSEDSNYTTTKC